MGKILLLLIVGIGVGFYLPQTRPTMVEYFEPLLTPIHKYSTTNELERIGLELTSYERTYFRLPAGQGDFPNWLEKRFVQESTVDSWGNPYALRIGDQTFSVVSAGPDYQLDTADDLRWTQTLSRQPRRR